MSSLYGAYHPQFGSVRSNTKIEPGSIMYLPPDVDLIADRAAATHMCQLQADWPDQQRPTHDGIIESTNHMIWFWLALTTAFLSGVGLAVWKLIS